MVVDLSVLIPARNEEFVSRTVADVLANSRGQTEIVVVLDGDWTDPPIDDHPAVTVIKTGAPIGQRAATNLAATLATGRYVMKLDGHCAVAEGYDVELVKTGDELGRMVTQIPLQKNLHIYSWSCRACGHSHYQGPVRVACPKCGAPDVERVIVWKPKPGSSTSNWTFDATLKFQYASGRKQTGDVCDVLTSLGACFVMTRDRFWELGGLDVATGSWGQYGVEIACKSWLSGGRHVVNKRTWFAHFFRVGGIPIPYDLTGSQQERAREYSRGVWRANAWPGQVRTLRSLVDQFWPVPGWTEADRDALPSDLPTPVRATNAAPVAAAPAVAAPTVKPVRTKGIAYYTHNVGDRELLDTVRKQLRRAAVGLPIASVQSGPLDWADGFGDVNVRVNGGPGALTMFRQILAALEALSTDVAFLCEHDVLYAPEHFDFDPPSDRVYYYNVNTWKVDAKTGRAVTYLTKQTSGCVANRELLVEHYRKRVALVEANGFTRAMGFEPGSHKRAERIDDIPSEEWRSAVPNIDLRHGANLTESRWSPTQFRSQKNCQGWREDDGVEGWGVTRGRMPEFLGELA